VNEENNMNKFLTNDNLRTIAPAIFSTAPAEHVSGNYQFVSTENVLGMMEQEGWGVISAKQQKVQQTHVASGRTNTTKHTLLLRHRDTTPTAQKLGGLIPTIRLINSHDWSSRFSMFFGMLRLICSNGLTASGAQFAGMDVRHDNVRDDLQQVLQRFSAYSGSMLDTADRWDRVMLSNESRNTLGMQAARIRFGAQANSDHANYLLTPRRYADASNTLWETFNVIQENAMQGGGKVGSMQRTARQITNIGKEHTINSELFELAASFA